MITPQLSEIRRFLTRGVTHVVPHDELEHKLAEGERMRVYLGVDPTGSSIHLGHAVVLRKLHQLQQWGHEIIFLIGDFTAQIGDPTGRDVLRKPLTREEILENARDYQAQVGRIVSFEGDNAARILYNSSWLASMTLDDAIRIASHFTVQQMLERDMFQERLKMERPIGLHEFFYPLMQGYDSVAMNVDMEMGGNDQLFNIMTGRTLLMSMHGKSKIVFTCDLLEGTDGRKMSKSYGNVISVTDSPSDMFGKIMSLKDEHIARYFELCTDDPKEDIDAMKMDMASGALNPRDAKMRLAHALVTLYHSSHEAEKAHAAFAKVFRGKEIPDEIPDVILPIKELPLLDLLVASSFAASRTEARRLVEQGGVKINKRKMEQWDEIVCIKEGDVLQVGKRKFARVR